MPQPWPWVKVTKRSSSTFPQTHIFFVPNILRSAQKFLTWETKVVAAAAAAAEADDATETNWKHKVTPDRGDLIRKSLKHCIIAVWCTAATLHPKKLYIDGLVQDCGMSSVLAMEMMQFCTKPLIYIFFFFFTFCCELNVIGIDIS